MYKVDMGYILAYYVVLVLLIFRYINDHDCEAFAIG